MMIGSIFNLIKVFFSGKFMLIVKVEKSVVHLNIINL